VTQRILGLFFLVTLAACAESGDVPQADKLDPIYAFRLASPFEQDAVPLLWRLRADQAGLWFVFSGGQPVRYWVTHTTLTGQVRPVVPMDPSARNVELTPTSRGFACLVVHRRGAGSKLEATLTEHDAEGRPLWSRDAFCSGFDALTALDGRPALVCRDGALLVYDGEGPPVRKPSWARHRVILVPLGQGRAALVDQETAQVLLQDLEGGGLKPVSAVVPEIEEARRRNLATRERMIRELGPEEGSRGTPLIALDAASDSTSFSLLVFPSRPEPERVSVVRFDADGRLIGRYRCRFDGKNTPVRIAMAGELLVVAGARGYVYIYRMPPSSTGLGY
jgi:hypothetical protein